jgi:hypothetical protein
VHFDRFSKIENIKSLQDVQSILASHDWELLERQQYGNVNSRGEAGVLVTFTCKKCGAEWSSVILPRESLG